MSSGSVFFALRSVKDALERALNFPARDLKVGSIGMRYAIGDIHGTFEIMFRSRSPLLMAFE